MFFSTFKHISKNFNSEINVLDFSYWKKNLISSPSGYRRLKSALTDVFPPGVLNENALKWWHFGLLETQVNRHVGEGR
jgi:hypothetical protein